MNASLLIEAFNWVLTHFPAVATVLVFTTTIAWIAVKANNFSHRLEATERLCNDIHNRQLPEIRTELKEIRVEMNQRFSKIELSLNTIITYLSTKSGKFNIGDNKS